MHTVDHDHDHDPAGRESIWAGPAWWFLLAAAAVAGAVLAVWFSMYLLAWLMVFAGTEDGSAGVWETIAGPNGAAAQIGLQTLACLVTGAGLVLALGAAWRRRTGGTVRRSAATVGLALLTSLTTLCAAGYAFLIVAFGTVDDALHGRDWPSVAGLGLVQTVLVAAAYGSWRLSRRSATKA